MSDVSTLVALCPLADVPEGEALRLVPEGFPPLAVYNVKGRIFVSDDTCTHGEASLAEGELDEDELTIICPFHLGSFDLCTGAAAAAPCSEPLKVYENEVMEGIIYIKAPFN
jgi:p-cumate 2,3-dioxygenase ferredoxin subunit